MKGIYVFLLVFCVLGIGGMVVDAAPNAYSKELPSDVNLRGALFTDGDGSPFYAWLDDNGRIHITSSSHYQDKTIKLKYTALTNRLKNFNGKSVGITHIADDGTVDNFQYVLGQPDSQGFVYITADFSEIILNGFDGISITLLTGLSGNQSISVPNGTQYDLNITNNQGGEDAYGNDKFINFTVNSSMVSGTNSDFPLGLSINIPSGIASNGANVRIYYINGTEIPREIESYNETSDDLMVWYKPDSTTDVSDVTYQIWYGNTSAPEPAANSTYGSQAVWDSNYVYVSHMDDLTTSTISDSTSYERTSTKLSSNNPIQVDAEYGKAQDFSSDYVIIPDSPDFDFTDFTFESYHYKDTDVSGAIMSKFYDGSARSWEMDDSTLFDAMDCYVNAAGSPHAYSATNSMIIQTWHYTAVLHDDSSTSQWYVNDSASGAAVDIGAVNANAASVKIGDRTHATSRVYFDGKIAEVRLSNVLRSTDYVSTTSNNLHNPTASGTLPFYKSIGSEQEPFNESSNITASVTGDSNTQTYNTSQSREFTLIPTGTTNFVNITTNSTNYDVNITTYWTEDFVTFTESVSGGFANYSVDYTPSENITSGFINATYSLIDFSEHDYIGNMTVTFNGTPITNATRTDELVSIPVSNLDTSTHSFFISIPYNPQPTMIYPDGQTLSFSFPPLNHDVPANWSITTGIYRYTVTTQGGVFVAQDTVTTNSTTFSLPAGDYFWYVQGYDDVFDEYSSATNVFNFTVENDYGILNTTAIVGVVYSQDGQTKTPITNAVVSITNDTWSDSIVVGADGFYSFLNLAGNETYFLQASAEYFDDSGSIIVTTNPNNVTQRDILLTTTTTDYVPHFVKFIVKSLFGTKYSDVNINIYKGDAAAGVVFRSGTTGADGSATFRLDQNQQYTITFINEQLGISETKTLYPVDNEYPIIVFRTNMVPDDRDQDDILFGAYGQSINLTHGYINVSFNDTSGTTTQANMWIKDTNLTTLYSFSTTNSSAAWSQVVEGGNSTYIVEFNLQNTVLDDTLEITRTIKFRDVVNFDLGFDEGWKYIFVSSAILILLLLLASRLNAEIMTGIVILAAWLLTFLGWTTAGLTTAQSITVGMMLLFGTILAFGAIIRRGEQGL